MPVFPGEVTHNNPNAKILDLTRNQVKGIGMFDTIGERNSLDERMRHEGYIAIVGTVAYIFVGPTWTDENSWETFGGLRNVVEDLTPELGGDLNVNGKRIVSSADRNIVFKPAGTGRINLDGVVEFKRFPVDSPPAPFEGGMYADDRDNLYLGVSSA